MEPRKLTVSDIDKVRNIEGFPIGADEDIIALSRVPYYTACPNPFIEEFIRENGTPYDEENDDYHMQADGMLGYSGQRRVWYYQLIGYLSAKAGTADGVIAIREYISTSQVFMCPSVQTGYELTAGFPAGNYAMIVWAGHHYGTGGGWYVKPGKVANASKMIVIQDSPMPYKAIGSQTSEAAGYYYSNLSNPGNSKQAAIDIMPMRHTKKFNSLMGDGSVKHLSRYEVTTDNIAWPRHNIPNN